jgi:hypothetical protein
MFKRYEATVYNNNNESQKREFIFLHQARIWSQELYSKQATMYQIIKIKDSSIIETKYLVLEAHDIGGDVWWYAMRWGNKIEAEHARKDNEKKLKEKKKKNDNV